MPVPTLNPTHPDIVIRMACERTVRRRGKTRFAAAAVESYNPAFSSTSSETNMAQRDYYEILGVQRTASDDEIKRAYRKLAKQFHPDQNKGEAAAEARFKEIQEAYSVLSNKEKRQQYDAYGHAGAAGGPGGFPGGGHARWSTASGQSFDFGDIADMFDFGSAGGGGRGGGSVFEEFVRKARGGRGARHAPPPSDIEHPVTLTFEQAVRGTTLDFEMKDSRGHSQHISVRIPPGVREGQRIRVRGQGQPSAGGGPSGDLYVVCSVQSHRYFERNGNDIYLDVPVTIAEAALGAKIDLPTLEGIRTVTIPPGTPSGAKLRLTGLGVPSAKGGARGDHYAVIKIVPPKKPTKRQRELLEQLKEADGASPREGLWG